MLQRAFTLIEVNLAIFIMAGGVLAMISLYSLGFRESRQSREDVASAALADHVLNPLVVALSSRDMTWKQWQDLPFEDVSTGADTGSGGSADIQVLPKNGWLAYFEPPRHKGSHEYYVKGDPYEAGARTVYSKLVTDRSNWGLPASVVPPQGMTFALVASRESKNSPVITLAVRCVRKNLRNTLMSQPVFSTEVHFQGDPNR